MLAPLTVTGGITTWYQILRKFTPPERATFETIDTSKLYEALGTKPSLRGGLLGVIHGLRRYQRLARSMSVRRPDVVYVTCAPGRGFLVRDHWYVRLCASRGIPVVLHLHGGNVSGFLGTNAVTRRLARGTYRRSSAVIVITREIEQALVQSGFRDRTAYVPNMMDDDVYWRICSSEQGGRRIPGRVLHVAWQSPEKGSFDLIRAMAISKRATSCHMVGVVAPEYYGPLHAEIERLGLKGRVHLRGPLYGDDLASEFQEASLFVLPTHRDGPEGFPMTVLEAMMYGVPVVANNVGNIEEMLTGDAGRPAGRLLEQVDPVDPCELARKTDEVLESRLYAEGLGTHGRERVRQEFLASSVVPRILDVLDRVVGNASRTVKLPSPLDALRRSSSSIAIARTAQQPDRD